MRPGQIQPADEALVAMRPRIPGGNGWKKLKKSGSLKRVPLKAMMSANGCGRVRPLRTRPHSERRTLSHAQGST
jgi:hypothetical protein